MPGTRFGILSFPIGPYEELARLWRSLDELGFDSAWMADDLNRPGYADFEPWLLLGALARETSRLRIGTLVTTITYRHPALLAGQTITLDHVSDGRAEVGIGSGGPPNDYAMIGEPVWPPRERMERLEEQVAILDSLLRGEPVAYDGRYYRTAITEMPAPVQRPRPPLIVAAHGDRGLRLAARYADGWNVLGGQPYVEAQDPTKRVTLAEAVAQTRRLNERLDAYCREAGRDPATVRRSVLAYRPAVDPLSSLDAFDEYVGRYREIGIDEIVFYWPPLDNLFPRRPGSPDEAPVFDAKRPVSPAQQAAFERIATERIARR